MSAYYDTDVETTAKLFEILYKNDDTSFETLRQMFRLHMLAAEFSDDEKTAEYHLKRAFELAVKSAKVSEQSLDLPLLWGLEIQDAPCDNFAVARTMLNEIQSCKEYLKFKIADWFCKIIQDLENIIE